MSSWRITAKGVEHIMLFLMGLFFAAAVALPFFSLMINLSLPLLAIMELLILVIVAIFSLTYLVAKLWEVQVYGHEEHAKSGFFRKLESQSSKKSKSKRSSKKSSSSK